jgi:hypothetical protein
LIPVAPNLSINNCDICWVRLTSSVIKVDGKVNKEL